MFWLSYVSNLVNGGTMKVMILGAGGGIGLALLEAYAQAPETTKIFATHHRPVSDVSPLVSWLLLDLGDPDSVAALAAQVDDAIDRWICCTGILAYPDHGPEKSLRQLNAEKLQRDHMINAIGPLTAFAALAPRLRSSQLRAAFLSAQVGSIEDNRLGGWHGYRMSKAALNMGVKCLAIECARWRNDPTIIAVHPGTTKSNLSRSFIQTRKAPVQSAAVCADNLKQLIESLQPEQNGQFLRLSGERLPW